MVMFRRHQMQDNITIYWFLLNALKCGKVRKFGKKVNRNFSCCFVWMCNLVSHTRGRNGLRVSDKSAEENIWRQQVVGGWKSLHNEEFHNLYASSDITVMTKS
jgi:hypothetical protein